MFRVSVVVAHAFRLAAFIISQQQQHSAVSGRALRVSYIVVRWSESCALCWRFSNATAPRCTYISIPTYKRMAGRVVVVIYGVDCLTDGKTHSKQHHSNADNRIYIQHTIHTESVYKRTLLGLIYVKQLLSPLHRVSSSFCPIAHSAKTNAIFYVFARPIFLLLFIYKSTEYIYIVNL